MNMIKKNGGFTLVELIVVIAILAILAGVAVPAYSGYITKAKDAAAIVELDAIATAAQAANATAGEIGSITVAVGEDATTVTVQGKVTSAEDATETTYADLADDFYTNFDMFYEGATVSGTTITIAENFEGTSYAAGATWTSAGWAKK